MRFLALISCICVGWMCAATAQETGPGPPKTRQARACGAWHSELRQMLDWSELFGIHAPELRLAVRTEARKLRDRCARDISMASLNRYALLAKLLYDDEADEFESFD